MDVKVINDPVDCETAEEFLEAISPNGPYFRNVPYGQQWLFRGQPGDWPFVASFFRGTYKLSGFTQRRLNTYDEIQLAERDVLIRFFEVADRRGLVLPDDSQQLRSNLETLKSPRRDFILPKGWGDFHITLSALSLVALAQHYGLPTRLLDWSLNVHIAAFFACKRPGITLDPALPSDRLVLWSFLHPNIGKQDSIGYGTTGFPIIVTAPTASNPNLKSQQGVFTYLDYQLNDDGYPDVLPLDAFLSKHVDNLRFPLSVFGNLVADSRLQKFTLPADESEQLLYLLGRLGFTPSLLFPDYASIVEDLILENTWSERTVRPR